MRISKIFIISMFIVIAACSNNPPPPSYKNAPRIPINHNHSIVVPAIQTTNTGIIPS